MSIDFKSFIDYETMDRIKSIQWFKNCGNGYELFDTISFPTVCLNSWDEARDRYESSDWDDVTLEARNELTNFLSAKFNREYQFWNEITLFYKDFLSKEVFPSVKEIIKTKGIDETVFVNVEWDILGALMEGSYRKQYRKKGLFTELLKIYEAGHFPCGWEGEYPSGHLCVY